MKRKIQIQKGSGNKQVSSEPNTTMIQIGTGALWGAGIILLALTGLVYAVL